MKLRNNKTGEIVVFGEGIVDLNKIGCKNVAGMIEAGWEDYEEPIEFWTINLATLKPFHVIEKDKLRIFSDEDIEKLELIGFKFETREEAEKALEKLKAWKRLKNKGFHWLWYNSTPDGNSVEFYISEWDKEATRDLDLLFGGEEC